MKLYLWREHISPAHNKVHSHAAQADTTHTHTQISLIALQYTLCAVVTEPFDQNERKNYFMFEWSHRRCCIFLILLSLKPEFHSNN